MFLKVMISILVGSLMAFADAAVSRRSTIQPSNWVPYPWATPLPFTWSTAQGVWSVGIGAYSSYFYIKVSRDAGGSGAKYLTIVEKDAQTCETVATGFGKEDSTTRIMAEMKTIPGERYSMMLRLFHPNELPTSHLLQPIKGKVLVMTIRVANSRKDYNYPMTKISDRTEYRCNPQK